LNTSRSTLEGDLFEMLHQLQCPGKGDDVDDPGRAGFEFVRCIGADDPTRGDKPSRPFTGLERIASGQRFTVDSQYPYTPSGRPMSWLDKI